MDAGMVPANRREHIPSEILHVSDRARISAKFECVWDVVRSARLERGNNGVG
jgi:hypothetical protein